MAERNHQARKYKDTWEAVLTKVMEHLDELSRLNERRMWSLNQVNLGNTYGVQKAGSAGSVVEPHALLNFTDENEFDLDSREVDSLAYTEHRDIVPDQLFEPPASHSEGLLTIDYPYCDSVQVNATRRPLREVRDILAFGEMSSDEFVDENRYELHMFDELFSRTAG